MDTPITIPPRPPHLIDARLRHAKEVIEQVFDAAARLDTDRPTTSKAAIYRLEILRELAFDVAVATDALSRDMAEPDAQPTLRIAALEGLDEAKTMLAHLIELETATVERLSAAWPDEAARRA